LKDLDANATATAAVMEALREKSNEAAAADALVLKDLMAKEQSSAADLANCERVVAILAQRCAEKERLAQKSETAYAVALMLARAASEEYEVTGARARDVLGKEEAKCETEAEAARQATGEAEKKASKDDAALRHQEEGEAQTLAVLRQVETQIVQAHHSTCSDADMAEMLLGSQGEPAATDVVVGNPNVPHDGEEDAPDCAGDDEEDALFFSGDFLTADPVDSVSKVRREETAAVGTPAVAKKADLSSRRPQDVVEMVIEHATTTHRLLHAELDFVAGHVRGLQENLATEREAIKQRTSGWQEERNALLADLQLASLRLAAARDDVVASDELRATALGKS